MLKKQADKNFQEIWLGGGCFWGVEAYVRKLIMDDVLKKITGK